MWCELAIIYWVKNVIYSKIFTEVIIIQNINTLKNYILRDVTKKC
jgi:hypothetical protein